VTDHPLYRMWKDKAAGQAVGETATCMACGQRITPDGAHACYASHRIPWGVDRATGQFAMNPEFLKYVEECVANPRKRSWPLRLFARWL